MTTGSTAVSTGQQWQLVFKTGFCQKPNFWNVVALQFFDKYIADVAHAGTEPEIFCRLMSDGRTVTTSPKIRCSDAKKDKKSFKRGATDTYKFTLPTALDGNVNAVSFLTKCQECLEGWQTVSCTLSDSSVAQ